MKVRSIRLRNFLGFGNPGSDLTEIGEREVIVGANGSGKSSLLHAIEFVGRAFQSEGVDGRTYVHRADWSRSIDVEVGVDLDTDQTRALATLFNYGTTLEQSQVHPDWKINQSSLNLMVRAALSSEPRLFDQFLSSQKMFLRVSSVAGVSQGLQPVVEFRWPDRSLFLTRHGTLTTANRELSGWGLFDLQQEILKQANEISPGLLSTQPADLPRLAESIVAAVRSWTPQRVLSQLQAREDFPVALRLEWVAPDTRRPDVDTGDPALIHLRMMLSQFGFNAQQVSTFNLVSAFYNGSIASLSASRSRPERVSIQSVGIPTESSPNVTGQQLPLLLFLLKNGWDETLRGRFRDIQEAFERLTTLSFDVVLNPEYDEVPAPSPGPPEMISPVTQGQAAPRPRILRHYPYIVFKESEFSYLAEHAASGFFEVLLVLAATIGPTKCVILLDEPVLNLHPSKQRQLYSFLSGRASELGNQLLIVTHSSTFVSADDLARAIRFEKRGDAIRALRLETSDPREAARRIKELDRTPRLVEALFARGAVVVEGGDEAAGLPVWFEKCGGNELTGSGVVFIDAGSQTHFGTLVRILEAWGIPYRVIADEVAKPIVEQFREKAKTYPFVDYAEMLRGFYPDLLREVVAEGAGASREKDPAVARELAMATEPPAPVKDLWEWLRPFCLGPESD